MCEKIEVSKAILTFLTGVRPKKNEEEEYDSAALRRAFDNAYRDMATHTLKYNGTPRDAAKKKLKDDIFDQIKEQFNVSEMKEDFNKWHKSFCQYIVKKVGDENLLGQIDDSLKVNNVFTYGQAQKLVNMMLKYLYVYDKCNGGTKYDELIKFFHVPLDRNVFRAMSESGSKEFNKDGNYIHNGNKIPWSKINDYDTYTNCQKAIRGLFENHIIKGFDSPFEWELANWPFEQ